MTPYIQIVSVVASCLIIACSGASTDSAVQETTPPQPDLPRGEPVSFLDLVPAQANAAALVHVTQLRSSSHGPALTNLVRRLGVYRWEDALNVDLRTEVERVLIFGVANEENGPGDLSQVIDSLRGSNLGAIIELREEAEGEAFCGDQQLATLEGRPVDPSIPGVSVYRCGRFVIMRRDDLGGTLGPHRDGSLTGVLSSVLDSEAYQGLIFVAVASPEMIDRVSCGENTVQLSGWQQATIELGDGMTLRGRYHASTSDAVPQLEQCVSDGMGGFSSVPLFSELELSDVLENATISHDENTESDVLLEASFSESELDLMLGLLELVGSGIQ